MLGGSNGAYAAAADLALSGHRIRLWRRSAADFEPVLRSGRIRIEGDGVSGEAVLERATTDLKEVLDGAEVVLVPLPATAQEDLAARCAPYLASDQVVLLIPGTLGSLVFARAVKQAGGTLPWALAETGTLPYLARKVGPATVRAPVKAANLPTGVFPGERSTQALSLLSRLYPSIRPCCDALDAALTNAGTVIHPPLVLLNAGPIEAGRYDIHASGTTAGILRVIYAVDAERIRIREALGYPAPHYELATYYEEARAAEGLYGRGAKQKLVRSGLWNERLTLDHRYVSEDVALGLTLFTSLAAAVAVEAPVSRAVVTLSSALLGRDLQASGRTVERLGLSGPGVPALRELFRSGGDLF
ncbi:MAG: NAD/NADP octopine/nopaline dehydrogenase family protein [Candidatus Rokubacteria bacterium]|nr:NAD/NADP octopine/nopaline dehydrogenase family protein [Candidatus Rokubacteria bacterium]